MEEFTIDQQFTPQEPKRPTFLKVLCILTFISTGMGIVSLLFNTASGPMNEDQIIELKVEMAKNISQMKELQMDGFVNVFEQIEKMSLSINEHFYASSLVAFLVMVLGLYSALTMWKGRKLGFHLYIIYNLVAIAQTYLFVDAAYVPTFVVVVNLIVSAIFIFMYSRNLHWMNK